ncbi:MAG: MucR family transcriptional regulator [Gammaproteobacteria bacterium]
MSESSVRGIVSPKSLRPTITLVSAYFSVSRTPTAQIVEVIQAIHGALLRTSTPPTDPSVGRPPPAVPIRQSVTPDYLICLEDGRQMKMLKRHLRTKFGLTPDEYRKRWGLPTDYPMIASNYAMARSRQAKQSGLGRDHSWRGKSEPDGDRSDAVS